MVGFSDRCVTQNEIDSFAIYPLRVAAAGWCLGWDGVLLGGVVIK